MPFLKKLILTLIIIALKAGFITSQNNKLCEVIENVDKTPKSINCIVENKSFISNYDTFSIKSNESAQKEFLNSLKSLNADTLKIFEYNLDKSGYGGDSPLEKGAEELINRISSFAEKENIDILILVEIARDCISYGNNINTAAEISKRLGYEFVFNPEFYIPNQSDSKHQCLIGNAILSKYPIIKYDSIVFENQCCNYSDQIGKRNSIVIDINVKNKNYKIFGLHLESGKSSFKSFFEALKIRYGQLHEIDRNIKADIKKDKNYYEEFFVGGDFNNPLLLMKSPFCPFATLLNYFDAHDNLPYFSRNTCPFDKPLAKLNFANLDYIYSYKRNKFENSKILKDDMFYGYSDHFPIITNYRLD